MILEVTPIDVYSTIQGAIVTALATLGALIGIYIIIGKPIKTTLFDGSVDHDGRKRGFFPRIEQRFDEQQQFQAISTEDRAAIRREMATSQLKVDHEFIELTKMMRNHEDRLLQHDKEIAFLQGKETARMELAANQLSRTASSETLPEA